MDAIASVFRDTGLAGALIFACVILIFLLLKSLKDKDTFAQQTQAQLVEVIKNSSAAHMSVAIVLSRIEAQLGLPIDPWATRIDKTPENKS